jgi:superfamily I DNA/RNA helicase
MSEWDDIPQQAPVVVEQEKPKYKWSDEQLAMQNWAKNSKKNARVTARAGTGKTKSIEAMVVPAAPEKRILYVVFNKKNQLEAKEKITDPRVDIKTFNALGYGFVKQNWQQVRPDDQVEKDRIVAVAGKKIPQGVMEETRKIVAWAKNTAPMATKLELEDIAFEQGFTPEPEDEEQGWTVGKMAQVALEVLELSKMPDAQNRVSFNDQVWLPVVMGWVRPFWDLIVVDEAQDMNVTQREMIRKCYKREGGRIMFVGDDRQSIYRFRGAAQDSMGQLAAFFKTEELTLTTTYRCAKKIVELAKEAVPDYRAADDAAEGVVKTIYGTNEVVRLVKPGDAILSRVNAPLMPLCLALLKLRVPARIEGRVIGRQLAQIAAKFKARTVREFLEAVKAWAARRIERILAKDMDYEKRGNLIAAIRDQEEIFFAVADDAPNVATITMRLNSLFQDSDQCDPTRPVVILSSVHRAKGLEWDRVFMLMDTFRRQVGGEEANIWYVATTRARKELVLVR